MSSNLTGPTIGVAQGLWIASATQNHRLGERTNTADGRAYRYCSVEPSATTVTGQVAGASLVAGNVIQAPAPVANHLARTGIAAAINDLVISAVLGATAAYVNQYAEGFVQVDTTPGNGIVYQISSHALVASSGTLTANLGQDDKVLVALTTSSTVGFHYNPYKAVIQGPVTTLTSGAVGVAHWALPSLTTGGATGQNYGWLQTRGPCPVLINGTPDVGRMVAWTAATAAGTVSITSSTFQPIGWMMQTGVDTKNNLVYLTID